MRHLKPIRTLSRARRLPMVAESFAPPLPLDVQIVLSIIHFYGVQEELGWLLDILPSQWKR